MSMHNFVYLNTFKLFISYHSGAINYDDLLKSSESDCRSVEEIQSSISPDSGCNIQVLFSKLILATKIN